MSNTDFINLKRRRYIDAGEECLKPACSYKWILPSITFLPSIAQKWWLTATIDDATNEVPYAKLYLTDGVFNNMEVIRKTIEAKGLFYALYVDKASHFKTTRYGGLHVNVAPEQEETHIERALEELGIHLILAHSPQAKGRFDNTIKFQGDIIQIPPSKYRISFAKCVVEVCLVSSGRIYVLYKGKCHIYD